MMFLCVLILGVIFFMPGRSTADDASDFLDAVKLYNAGDYAGAASLFSGIAGKGVVNGILFYNAGNAYFKSGDIGHSLLWYERALKLIPGDPDLVYNYDYVNGLVKDKAEDKSSPVFRILFFWHHMMSLKAVQLAGILFFTMFSIIMMIRAFKQFRGGRPMAWICLSLSLIFSLTAYYDFYDSHFNRKGIVIDETVTVRSGLSDDATELFVLHQGIKVSVDDMLKGYVKIRLSDDKIGWIKKESVEII
jgi:tetratricopeptide (TPR) repeat protein